MITKRWCRIAGWMLMCGGVSPAYAAPFQVAIASAGTETIVDNGAGDLDLTVGIIQGTVTNNAYIISVWANLLATATGGQITNHVIVQDTVGLAPASISIIASFDEFLFAAPGMLVNASSTLSVTQLENEDSVLFISRLDGTTSPFLDLTGPDPVGPATRLFSDVIALNPFTMSNTMVINGLSGPGQTATLTGETVAGVTAVPEPGSLLLLGSGLFAGAIARRRRRRTGRDLGRA